MDQWWERSQRVMPGGVSSPVRSFRGVGGTPFVVDRGQGARLYDQQGNSYIDYVMSYGPLILGHAHPRVVSAIEARARQGTSYGAPTALEVMMAERLTGAYPGMQMVRLVNSGTEATMSALRVARAATGRSLVLKFTGCYHGHHDSLLVRAGSGAATLGVPDSAGVPRAMTDLTLTVAYNDREAVREVFRQKGTDIAAVIVEPVAGNMGTVPPNPGFLQDLRQLTSEAGSLLIFDEVMTGFRVSWGGAALHFGVTPDLVTLAKVIGAGLPVGAYGGAHRFMELVAPIGPVYQAGTLSGNPLAMAAGLAQLGVIGEQPNFYSDLASRVKMLADGLVERARRHGVPASATCVGGMMSLFFSEVAPTNFEEVEATDTARYRAFFHGMLEHGIFMPPSKFETVFVSAAHGDDELEATLCAAEEVFRVL